MGKTSPSGKGCSIASRRADENLHMRAMAEKSLCPMIFLENGCVEGRVLCGGELLEPV